MRKQTITLEDDHFYFFGYYDLQPYNGDNTLHLTHRVAFQDRVPNAEDVAEIGYIIVGKRKFVKIAETHAWNFQQGALLNWFEEEKSVIFNDYDGEKYVSRVVSLSGEEIKRYELPLATISSDKKKGLSINFARIYDFRKGYGYCNKKDVYYGEKAPREDGIFLVDLTMGEKNLLLSYADMKALFAQPPFTEEKLVINHLNFSPSGEKFVFLLRNFSDGCKKWGTLLGVADLKGNVKKLTGFEVNSHYSFKDDNLLMIYSGLPEWGVYFIDLNSGARSRLHNALCDKDDIHCNYSPDKSCFIADGYPQDEPMRSLYRYDFKTGKAEELLKVYSIPVSDLDIRCDLHARWNQDGKRISYDTTENGRREIMEIIL